MLSKAVTPRTIEYWLHRCRYEYGKYCKAEYKDGAMDDEVLDNLFTSVLPKFAKLSEMGMLCPTISSALRTRKTAARCRPMRRPGFALWHTEATQDFPMEIPKHCLILRGPMTKPVHRQWTLRLVDPSLLPTSFWFLFTPHKDARVAQAWQVHHSLQGQLRQKAHGS